MLAPKKQNVGYHGTSPYTVLTVLSDKSFKVLSYYLHYNVFETQLS